MIGSLIGSFLRPNYKLVSFFIVIKRFPIYDLRVIAITN